MEWVEGVSLEEYVRSNCGDKRAMRLLAYRFSQMAAWLMAQPFAHGDINPDNVIVRADGSLVLIDYDGISVGRLDGLGSQDFRHPSQNRFHKDHHVDDFPLVSILLSLRVLAENPRLLLTYGAKGRLLFSVNDYLNISNSKVMHKIYPSKSKEINKLVGLFSIALSRGNLDGAPPSWILLSPPDEDTDVYKSFTVNGVSFRMVCVKGEPFIIGATPEQGEGESNEYPPHLESISDYYIGETQVTQRLWMAVMGTNPSKFKGDDLPVECVSCEDWYAFNEKLNTLTGCTFRLPTEAEWEFAARGGNKSKGYKYAGSNDLDAVGWYDGNSEDRTHPVATKQPNELGIYDMSGNVWEWCGDIYFPYPEDYEIPHEPPPYGNSSVIRGGGWSSGIDRLRLSARSCGDWNLRSEYIGFRLAL